MMNIKLTTIFTILLSFMLFGSTAEVTQAQQVRVSHLRVEYLQQPMGIDMPHSRFSWILKSSCREVQQKAYQLVVATEMNKLTAAKANVWNTEQVSSDETINIAYEGKPLQSNQTYYWKVRVQVENGQWSNWSRTASFHTGLMNQSDWQGVWIGARDTMISAPQLRKEFNINKKIKNAYVFISGLGYYELYINGDKVGNHVLDPGTTNYNKRALYATYDVTKYVKSGQNAIGVWLGDGYFRTNNEAFRNYGDRVQLMFQMVISYADGTTATIVSNTSWKVSGSPIVANSVYNGEIYDARKENEGWSKPSYNDQDWTNAIQVNVPDSRKLSAQLMPPIRVVKTIYPVDMWEPQPGVYVYDFGQNLIGWPMLFVDGAEGQKVIMKTAEVTRKDLLQMKGKSKMNVVDTIDTRPNRSAKARDIYILAGKPGTERYHPQFTYHGFRYVQLEGYPGEPDMTSVAVQVVHTDVKKNGTFACSNALINQIHENIRWGQRSNLVSIPTDCPQRDERMGWMADAALSAEEAIYNFDMAAFYTNWLRLIEDSQNKNGSVPDIVPVHKYMSFAEVGTPAWQAAYPQIVWRIHKYYADNRVIKQHYESLKKWMSYMASIADDYIITEGRGDWVAPQRAYAPGDGSVPITSTGYYYKSAVLMKKMADVLGKEQDKSKYTKLANHIQDAFQQRFWNEATQTYGSGSQTSNAFPLYVGIVPEAKIEAVVQNLVHNIKYKHNNHLWVGILGTKALVEVLPKYGKSNLLYSIATQTTFPSWGYMIAKGATTLWERWGGYRYFGPAMNSLNHIMFGSIDEFFYEDLAGIQLAAPGYKKIHVQPVVPQGLDHASASMKTIRGKVASSWKREGHTIEMHVTIPPNSTARISIPKAELSGPFIVVESEKTVWNDHEFHPIPGVKSADKSSNYISFEVGSGEYEFVLKGELDHQ